MGKDLPIHVHGSGGDEIRVVGQNPRQSNLPDSPFHFPDYHATWGEPERYNVRVSLSQKAYTQVMDHANSDRREVGGLLLGLAYNSTDDKSYHNRVVLALPHRHGIGQMATFAFTHEGWAALSDEVEREYPYLRIVGWYHSHPNYGAFFSGTDQSTQRNYFSTPWRVGLVVDHIRKEGSFFVLVPGGNKVEALPGFYEYVGKGGRSIIQWGRYKVRPAPAHPTSLPPPDPTPTQPLPPAPPPDLGQQLPYLPAVEAEPHIQIAAPVAAASSSSASSSRLPLLIALLAFLTLILLILANLQLASMGGNFDKANQQLVSISSNIDKSNQNVMTGLLTPQAALAASQTQVMQAEVAITSTQAAMTTAEAMLEVAQNQVVQAEAVLTSTQIAVTTAQAAVAGTETALAPTNTPTRTSTPTYTPTDTPTDTPTNTLTYTPLPPTSTPAPTNTPIPSLTNTQVPTNTPSPKPTDTLAPTNTSTGTTTPSPTPALSGTGTPTAGASTP